MSTIAYLSMDSVGYTDRHKPCTPREVVHTSTRKGMRHNVASSYRPQNETGPEHCGIWPQIKILVVSAGGKTRREAVLVSAKQPTQREDGCAK